jgi:surface antigen Omp85-like protein
MQLRHLAGPLALVIAWSAPAVAQSREDEIARQQEAKAQTTTPYSPNRVEVLLDQVEQGKWILGVPRGWYFAMGSVYPGGGLAAGAGHRQYIGYDSYVDSSALLSLKGYKRVRVLGFTPNHVKGRVDLEGSIAWLDAPQVAFYGLGNDSRPEDRANFRIYRSYIEGAAVVRPVKWLGLRLDGGVDDYTQKPGTGASPSIEQIFSSESAPLLGDDPLYLRGEASATAYWLQSPGYSRSGGLYSVAYEEFNPIRGNGGTFGFLRTQIVQHVPVQRETWVVSIRAGTESIVRKSDVVPYFLMPTLGSGDTLRGYANQRFRDRHSLLLSSELRWFPNRVGLDMAFFVDMGKVAPFRSGLTLNDLKTDYGIGVRFHTPAATALRIDVAKGDEGMRVVIAGGPAF